VALAARYLLRIGNVGRVIRSITSRPRSPAALGADVEIWMTPCASVAMLEKLALLKIARCSAPALSRAPPPVCAR